MSNAQPPSDPPPPSTPPPPATTPSPAAGPSPTAALEQPNLPVPVQPGERVLLLRRRHWIYLWPNILLTLLIAIVPAAAVIFFLDAVGLEGRAATIIVAVYLAFFLLRIVLIWYRYHNDYWVVTNQRVIDIKRNHPFDLKVSTADLVNIQDMTIERNGLLKTMLDYGDVVCQTAGTAADFRIGGVADPRAVQALVDRERDRERMRGRSG